MATRVDGNALAASVRKKVAAAVASLKSDGTHPCLATVLVGDDPASATYVRNKHRACSEAGIDARDHRLGADVSQRELAGLVAELNADPSVHGILVQMPLPGGLDSARIISGISPAKDVDGLTPYSAGLVAMGGAPLVPCTPLGVMEILDRHGVELRGKSAVIINRSRLVGLPLAHLMLARDATVTVCHSQTPDIGAACRGADVLVTAVGDRDRFTLDGGMVKEGAAVIDVAITRHGGKLAGDADYDSVAARASLITPVPGGVGPMTVAMLLKNMVTAASMSRIAR